MVEVLLLLLEFQRDYLRLEMHLDIELQEGEPPLPLQDTPSLLPMDEILEFVSAYLPCIYFWSFIKLEEFMKPLKVHKSVQKSKFRSIDVLLTTLETRVTALFDRDSDEEPVITYRFKKTFMWTVALKQCAFNLVHMHKDVYVGMASYLALQEGLSKGQVLDTEADAFALLQKGWEISPSHIHMWWEDVLITALNFISVHPLFAPLLEPNQRDDGRSLLEHRTRTRLYGVILNCCDLWSYYHFYNLEQRDAIELYEGHQFSRDAYVNARSKEWATYMSRSRVRFPATRVWALLKAEYPTFAITMMNKALVDLDLFFKQVPPFYHFDRVRWHDFIVQTYSKDAERPLAISPFQLESFANVRCIHLDELKDDSPYTFKELMPYNQLYKTLATSEVPLEPSLLHICGKADIHHASSFLMSFISTAVSTAPDLSIVKRILNRSPFCQSNYFVSKAPDPIPRLDVAGNPVRNRFDTAFFLPLQTATNRAKGHLHIQGAHLSKFMTDAVDELVIHLYLRLCYAALHPLRLFLKNRATLSPYHVAFQNLEKRFEYVGTTNSHKSLNDLGHAKAVFQGAALCLHGEGHEPLQRDRRPIKYVNALANVRFESDPDLSLEMGWDPSVYTNPNKPASSPLAYQDGSLANLATHGPLKNSAGYLKLDSVGRCASILVAVSPAMNWNWFLRHLHALQYDLSATTPELDALENRDGLRRYGPMTLACRVGYDETYLLSPFNEYSSFGRALREADPYKEYLHRSFSPTLGQHLFSLGAIKGGVRDLSLFQDPLFGKRYWSSWMGYRYVGPAADPTYYKPFKEGKEGLQKGILAAYPQDVHLKSPIRNVVLSLHSTSQAERPLFSRGTVHKYYSFEDGDLWASIVQEGHTPTDPLASVHMKNKTWHVPSLAAGPFTFVNWQNLEYKDAKENIVTFEDKGLPTTPLPFEVYVIREEFEDEPDAHKVPLYKNQASNLSFARETHQAFIRFSKLLDMSKDDAMWNTQLTQPPVMAFPMLVQMGHTATDWTNIPLDSFYMAEPVVGGARQFHRGAPRDPVISRRLYQESKENDISFSRATNSDVFDSLIQHDALPFVLQRFESFMQWSRSMCTGYQSIQFQIRVNRSNKPSFVPGKEVVAVLKLVTYVLQQMSDTVNGDNVQMPGTPGDVKKFGELVTELDAIPKHHVFDQTQAIQVELAPLCRPEWTTFDPLLLESGPDVIGWLKLTLRFYTYTQDPVQVKEEELRWKHGMMWLLLFLNNSLGAVHTSKGTLGMEWNFTASIKEEANPELQARDPRLYKQFKRYVIVYLGFPNFGHEWVPGASLEGYAWPDYLLFEPENDRALINDIKQEVEQGTL